MVSLIHRVGQKSDTLFVFEFPLLLDTLGLYLQFLFTSVSFSLNVVVRQPLSYANKLYFRHDSWIN